MNPRNQRVRTNPPGCSTLGQFFKAELSFQQDSAG